MMRLNDNNSSKEDGDWEASLIEYTLGLMDPTSAAEWERQLEECRAHVTMAREYAQVVGMLGYTATAAEPPAGHKSRFMALVDATPRGAVAPDASAAQDGPLPLVLPGDTRASSPSRVPAPRERDRSRAPVVDLDGYREARRRRFAPAAMFGAAAAAIVLLVGLWAWTAVSQAQQRVTALQSEVAAARSALNVPSSFVAFAVQGQGPEKDSTAVGFVNPATGEYSLYANGLQSLPAGKVYEAWWLPTSPNAKPVPAGTFNASQDGTARHTMTAPVQIVAEAGGMAVTVEAAPGVPAPAGPIVLAGTFKLP